VLVMGVSRLWRSETAPADDKADQARCREIRPVNAQQIEE
jgi:hypothetical protein